MSEWVCIRGRLVRELEREWEKWVGREEKRQMGVVVMSADDRRGPRRFSSPA